MKRFVFLLLAIFIYQSSFSQSSNDLLRIVNQYPGVYVDVVVNSKEEVQQLVKEFSIERGDIKKNGQYFSVKIWLTKVYIDQFIEKGIPYQIDSSSIIGSNEKPALTMATTVEQMASWNRYPTYSVYLQMLTNFQNNFPTICKIDTILAQTNLNHAILAARITNSSSDNQNKPAFLYSACIHGDEICGYVTMLRLMDYMLNNQSDTIVQSILNNVVLYICPLENPDGTFPTNNNSVSGSVRSNSSGYDLNRSYPEAGFSSQPNVTINEITSMLNFIDQKQIMMSANFHGGAELYNYAWDSWTSSERLHPDTDWWIRIGNGFADTIHVYAPSTYFVDEGGVTNGGDWYVVTGSKLDCLNYYHQCRDVTIEIASEKKTSTTTLPNFWNYLHRSLLHYIYEASLGINGQITDSVTQAPLEALVFITSHDNNQSCVYSYLPSGNYFRPIKSGSYSITYSSPGYRSKTFAITIQDGERIDQDVELVPTNYNVQGINMEQIITIYPNPSNNQIKIDFGTLTETPKKITFISMKGEIINSQICNENQMILNIRDFAAGVYFVKFDIDGEIVVKKLVVD